MVYCGLPNHVSALNNAWQFMDITSTAHKNCTVVSVAGSIDRTTAPQLEAALDSLYSKGQSRVVLDLAGVPEMSSAGLRVIISAAKRFRGRAGGDLCLAAPSRRVVEVLDLAGLLPVLCVCDTSEEAIANFAQRAK